jgi:hypothetical protein
MTIMATAEQVACVYDIEAAGRDEMECASYHEIANFIASHPRRTYLRVESKAFRQPLTGDEFLTQFPAA